jgi:thymidine kinase
MTLNPTLTVYTGPMWSGKTTRMLSDLERFRLQKRDCIAFKPALDVRYGYGKIVSHSGWCVPASVVKTGFDMLAMLEASDRMPQVVAVDEAFMISGVADALIWLYSRGTTVVVSTLDMSYTCKPFKEVQRLLPWATRIEKCVAVCVECGQDARYTHKKIAEDDREIQVGGAEMYEPRCMAHMSFFADKLLDIRPAAE